MPVSRVTGRLADSLKSEALLFEFNFADFVSLLDEVEWGNVFALSVDKGTR